MHRWRNSKIKRGETVVSCCDVLCCVVLSCVVLSCDVLCCVAKATGVSDVRLNGILGARADKWMGEHDRGHKQRAAWEEAGG